MAKSDEFGFKFGLFLGIMLASIHSVSCAGYLISAPNVFHLGIPESVTVTVSGVTRPVTIRTFLRDYPNRRSNFSHVQGTFQADEPRFMTLKVDASDIPGQIPDSQQYVYLVAICEDPQLSFFRESKILISYKDKIVLVQVDKPVYTPRQTVKIRIIPLDFDLKPSNDSVDVVIKNPQEILVQQWKRLTTLNGFITKAFYLGEHAMIGNWTIEARYGAESYNNTSVKFEVKEYVLPRFSVKIVAQNFILPSATTIEVSLVSRYTYGEAVQGSAVMRLSIIGRGIPETKFYTTNRKLTRGKVTVKVDINMIRKHPTKPWFPDGRRLLVQCDVIEEATGMRESAVDNTAYFVSTPYHVTAEDTARYFKPGLPFSVMATVLFPNKQPAVSVPVGVSAFGLKKRGKARVDILTKVGGKLVRTLRELTDVRGRALFQLDIPRNIRSVNIQIKTTNPMINAQENALINITALSYHSKSGGYLHIRHKGGRKVRVGETSSWDVFQTIPRNITKLHLMVLSRGRILLHRLVTDKTGINVVSSLAFRVTQDMVPTARVLVYYYEAKVEQKHRNEVVADSAVLEVEEEFANKAQLQVVTKSKSHLPGTTVKLRVRAGPGSTVALLGVDQSVYLLRKNNKLTRKKVFKDIRNLDLGCGVGPGRDSSEVFENAGLVVMSSNDPNTQPKQGRMRCAYSVKKRTRRSSSKRGEHVCCTKGRMPSRASCVRRALFLLNISVQCRQEYLRCCREETWEKETVIVRQRQFIERNAILEDDSGLDSEQIRKYFPETWIFEEHQTSASGELLLDHTLPDTITTWVLQAMVISNTSGYGMTEVSRITTFKNFFVTLLMPYSVQRGEQISVKAAVFNYGQHETEFKIHLSGDRTFCSMSGPGRSTQPITIFVRGNSAKSVSFTIVPVELGKVPIQIVASGRMVGFLGNDWHKDIVQRELLVVPEGVEHHVVLSIVADPQGVLRDARDNSSNNSTKHLTMHIVHSGKQMNSMRLMVPKGSVPGSVTATLHLTGNLIGPVVSSLITGGFGKLLRMPMGCGEQNMMYLAPIVYVLEYLTNTRQVSAEVERKAYRFIQLGYQQELGFRRKDKSFSAFGESRPGSTWLTAFVIKVFCAAQRFDGVAIDDSLVCESVTWLVQNQRQDGAFPEVQDMIHKSMLGGVHGTVAMTAFVLTALLECRCSTLKNKDHVIARAVRFLETEVDHVNKPYILAITTYALALANSPSGVTANTRLLHMSIYHQGKGNLIGPVVSSLITGGFGKLLRMPMGCGEQNMMYLAPIVYVLEYLTNTRQVSAEVERKAYRFIQLGYQQELGFRRKDKSFSAFGESRPGSTWLTAFVIKVFCAAQRFDGVAIDDSLVCESVTWLVQNQRQDGAFPEVQDMIHKSMLGGVHGTVAMTAFVLTALLECRCSTLKNKDHVIARAVRFLETEVDHVNKPYILAITTYALALANSPSGVTANTRLLHMSIYHQGKDHSTRNWITGGHALDIETAGYALLAQLHLGHLKLGGPVVTWLTKQRNAQGGFASTQDTCVALQALAKYSEKTAGAHLDLSVSISSDLDADWRRIYHLTKKNAMLQRIIDVDIRHNLPSSNKTCMFDLQVGVKEVRNPNKYHLGNGLFIVGRAQRQKRELRSRRKGRNKGRKCRKRKRKGRNRNCRRRKRPSKSKPPRKNKKQNKEKANKKKKEQKMQVNAPDALDIKVCTRYLKVGHAGMTILDIGIFTGFEPDKQSLIELQKNVRPTVDRFEFSDRSVVLYISKVPSDRTFCVKFQVNREFGVGEVQPVPVTIYDYYEPGDSCTKFYSPDIRSQLRLGICKGDQCKCTQGDCMVCDTSIQDADELFQLACKKHDFVIKGEVILVDEESRGKKSWLLYFIKVKAILKQGHSRMRSGQILEYSKRAGCECPDVREGGEYLIMGQKQNAQFVLDKKTTLMPWITGHKDVNRVLNVFKARMKIGYKCS